ncbi:hypothetical protein [Paenibacillus prosopidis]|uniref:Uncharacterized protein n=1 Tax=Paenibacillus prosopidis TaxID=630520 RepID=A0A368W369_9BACL|nr:hypothetical protein [Paenibacillus prosopidis]RCW49369.1 hypothetical protein DFP97_10427 [Paenibacillus prosopidis]
MNLTEKWPELADGQFVYVWGKLWGDQDEDSPFSISCYGSVNVYVNDIKSFASNTGSCRCGEYSSCSSRGQFLHYKKRLFIPGLQIMHHVYDYKFDKPNGVPWGRGNGWVLFSLSELLVHCRVETVDLLRTVLK